MNPGQAAVPPPTSDLPSATGPSPALGDLSWAGAHAVIDGSGEIREAAGVEVSPGLSLSSDRADPGAEAEPAEDAPDERNQVLALVVPARRGTACRLQTVVISSTALSDAIGGGLLEDLICSGRGLHCCLYLDEEREAKQLPENLRAARLAAALDWSATSPATKVSGLVGLRGDIVITGAGPFGEDVDVPALVISTARRLGLLGADQTERIDVTAAEPIEAARAGSTDEVAPGAQGLL